MDPERAARHREIVDDTEIGEGRVEEAGFPNVGIEEIADGGGNIPAGPGAGAAQGEIEGGVIGNPIPVVAGGALAVGDPIGLGSQGPVAGELPVGAGIGVMVGGEARVPMGGFVDVLLVGVMAAEPEAASRYPGEFPLAAVAFLAAGIDVGG